MVYHLQLWYWEVFWQIRRKHIEHGRNLFGHVNWYLAQNKSFCRDILALSYNHLSQHLKPCFLYFGIYPKDFEIPVMQLIQQIGSRNMEDVAEDYLEELIDQSLIQIATKRLDGGVKTCHIHDLL